MRKVLRPYQGLKCLPLGNFQRWLAAHYTPGPRIFRSTPIIGKDGRYHDRHTGNFWFEVDGAAYFEKPGSFLQDLAHADDKPLRRCELASVRCLVHRGERTLANHCRLLLEAHDRLLHIRQVKLAKYKATRKI